MIVGATSQNDAEPVISIWSRQRENLETARPPLGKVVKNFVRGIVQLAIAIALLAYVSHVVCHISYETAEVVTYSIAVCYNEHIDFIRVVGKYLAKLGSTTRPNE
jgi:negative regulator of sigma E activity